MLNNKINDRFIKIRIKISKIGKKISSFDLINPVDKAQLKTIYGVLSEDIKIALKGNTKGLNALSRANKYY